MRAKFAAPQNPGPDSVKCKIKRKHKQALQQTTKFYCLYQQWKQLPTPHQTKYHSWTQTEGQPKEKHDANPEPEKDKIKQLKSSLKKTFK